MKQQLHRSITFWSGMLMLAFIAWAWRDSFRYHSHVITAKCVWGSNWGGVYILHDSSLVPDLMGSRIRDPVPKNAGHVLQRPFFLRGQGTGGPDKEPRPETSSFCEYVRPYMAYQARDVWMGFIPYSLILAGVVLGWMGLLGWRGRRRKRMPNDEFPNAE